MEYSESIDRQIAELLATRHRVTPEHLPGVPDEQGADLLAHYAQVHGAEQHVVWDGRRLVRERPAQPAPGRSTPASADEAPVQAEPSAEPAKLSPVDQVLAAPVEKSLLDSAPSAGVSAWYWLLPLMLALPGGIVAWLLVRETNRTVARAMLVTGIVMTVLSIMAGVSMRGVLERVGEVMQQAR